MKIYKYFLLHNKKLKPWIKYWLYIKSKDKNYVLSDILDGTSFYLENSSNKNFNLFQINGNSIQDGTPTPSNQVPINSAGDAKNLYFLPEEGSSNGINYTKNDDGTINLVGTATANVSFPIFKNTTQAHIENGATYTFSSNQALPSGVEFRAEAFNNTSWLRHLIGSVLNSSHQVFTGTANSTNATKIRHLIYIASGTTVNITNLEIQFEKGSIKTSFTPEGKGFINEVISNKNLFNMDGKPSEDRLSSAGYTLKYNDDKTITINGTGTGAYKFLTWDLTLEAGTYIASGCPSGGSQNGYSFLINVGSSSYWDYGNGVSFTLIAKTTIQVHPIRIGSTIPTFNNVTFKPMIRLASSSAASFVPHQEQNISIPCQQPMRSIGNVRDEFIKQDGVWYEKHNIDQVVLNGSESGWLERDNTSENYIKFRNANALPYDGKGDLLLISDYFVTNIGANNASYSGNAICGNSGNFAKWLHISIDNTIVNSVETFKTWLSTHNTEVIYQLAEPIYLECTEEQIEALESIIRAYTYEPITNINSTDETPAYLKIQYYMEV